MNNALSVTTNKPVDGEPGLEGHILTVGEVAHFLRVPKSTVYKLARLGQIPALKSASTGDFSVKIFSTGCRADRLVNKLARSSLTGAVCGEG